MNYKEFKTAVHDKIRSQLPEDMSVQLQTVYKNNGLKLDGLTISSSHSNVSPTIFLNYYYENQDCFSDFDAICRDILLAYEHNKSPENINVDFFTNYEQVKHRLAYRLVSWQKNKELLQTVPHIRYLDLAIVFYCLLKISEKGNATILIHHGHLKTWHITAAQLHSQASRNMPKLLPYDFSSMSAVLSELADAGRNAKSNKTKMKIRHPKSPSFCPMYVLTNTEKLYGASCMLYPGLLDEISQKLHSDLMILPSSIHEVILLPAIARSQSSELAGLVMDINQTELQADEILSDHVYYYSKAEQALSMCS